MSALPAPAPNASEPPAARRLPFGILVVVALRVLEALGIAGVAVGWRDQLEWMPALVTNWHLVLVIGLVWAGAALLGAAGLLLRQSWGWVLTMVMVGLGLAFTLYRTAIGHPDYLELALLVVTTFYLNQGSVRVLAGRHRGVVEEDEA